MNKKLKTLLAIVTFVALPAVANAAECNLGENAKVVITPRALGAVRDAQPSEIVDRLYSDPDYSSVKAACSKEQILAAFIRINGPSAVGLNDQFKVPVLISSEPLVDKPATNVVSNPVVQSLPAAKPVETPELKAARTEMVSTKAQLATASTERDRLASVAASRRPGLKGSSDAAAIRAMLTPAEKAGYDKAVTDVATLSAKLASLEGTVKSLTRFAVATNQWNTKQDGQIANVNAKADEALQKAEEAKAAAEATESLPWWGWALIALSIILGGLAVLFAAIRGTPEVAEPDLSGVATKEDVDARFGELEAKVAAVQSRFEHIVVRTAETPAVADLKALADDAEFDYPLLVDGTSVVFKGKVVQHAPSGEALVKLAEFKNAMGASKLHKALCDYIENGGAMPTLRAVTP